VGVPKTIIKSGSLVKYSGLHGEILGLTLGYPFFKKSYNESAVKVVWFDDWTCTFEIVSILLSGEEEYKYMEIISEA